MMTDLSKVCWLFSPLLVGLAGHGLCIKFNWLSGLAHPLDGGRLFRGKPIFGRNKTYRGVIAVGIGTAAAFVIEAYIPGILSDVAKSPQFEIQGYGIGKLALVGLAAGVAAMLSELPNSFLKRQIGIAPGAMGRSLTGIFFYCLDQIDLLLGSWLVFSFTTSVTAGMIWWSVVFLFVAHQLMSIGGYWLGMRATLR